MTEQPALWPDTETGPLTGTNLRICLHCGQEFRRIVGQTGVKFCSRECQAQGYRRNYRNVTPPPVTHRCRACGTEYTNTVKPSRRSASLGICSDCRAKISNVWNRLVEHNVPADTIVQVIRDGAECRICETDLITPVRHINGSLKAPLVVDHDHQCCHGQRSCGNCIRGFLCHHCNAALGMLRDRPDLAIAAADYLQGNR